MLILDTDHMTEIERGSLGGQALRVRLERGAASFGTTFISVEELLRGRLAQIARCRDPERLVLHYARFQDRVAVLARWLTLKWDVSAAAKFEQLAVQRLGLGTMDLRIASIALTQNATLLSRNLRDFQRIPNLNVEDWLE